VTLKEKIKVGEGLGTTSNLSRKTITNNKGIINIKDEKKLTNKKNITNHYS